MNTWGRPNLSSPRYSVSEPETLPSTTNQRQPPRQQQLETQIPFVSNPELHDTALSPSSVVSNKPALWQLGRHSQYIPGTGYDQHSTSLSGQPGRGGIGHARDRMEKFDEAGLRDVEEELHRGLQARQVGPRQALRVRWSANGHIDFHDRIRRDNRYRFSHWFGDGFEAR